METGWTSHLPTNTRTEERATRFAMSRQQPPASSGGCSFKAMMADPKTRRTRPLLVAAVLCALLAGGFYFFPSQPAPEIPPARPENRLDLENQSPGSDAPLALSRAEELQPWERAVEKAILDSADTSSAFRALLPSLQSAPAAAQGVLAKHLTNLASDEDFASLIPPLFNRSLHSEFHRIIANDLLNRPDELKLPTLRDLIFTPWHPMREFAHEILVKLTLEDGEMDWGKWEEIIKNSLTKTASPPEPR
jgi:hypothetical protein